MKYNPGDIIKIIDPYHSNIPGEYLNSIGIILNILTKQEPIIYYIRTRRLDSLTHYNWQIYEKDMILYV